MSHSPEPWEGIGTNYQACVDALREIANDGPARHGMSDQEYAGRFLKLIPQGDVDRSVACVNACRGIPTDELEKLRLWRESLRDVVEAEADAARADACVKACTGIPTEELVGKQFKPVMWDGRAYGHRLEPAT